MQFLLPSQENGKGWHDAARSSLIGQIDIEFTSDCNLRCVYCPVSSSHYHGQTMDPLLVARLLADLPGRKPIHIGFNGHGETTIIPGWLDIVQPFIELTPHSHIISNFSKTFTQLELEALARVGLIIVSLDTVDNNLLKEIRRKVDLRTIVLNIINIRSTALALGIPAPRFQVNAGIYDRNVFGLADLARFCVALKIEAVSFWSLVVHSVFVSDIKCDTVLALSDLDLQRAVSVIEEAITVLQDNNVQCIIPGNFVEEIKRLANSGVSAVSEIAAVEAA